MSNITIPIEVTAEAEVIKAEAPQQEKESE